MLINIRDPRHIWLSIIISSIMITLILLVLPDEETLGSIIKIIYVHIALVQASLFAFAGAGILGLINLFKNEDKLFQRGAALQKTALLFWLLYYGTSMIATYLSWGVWIEWNEPRVQIAIRVIAAAIIFLVLSIWINKRKFTEITNIVMAVIVIYATKSAMNIRHPISPIGDSESIFYRAALMAIFFLTMVILIQVNRLIMHKYKSTAT